LIPFSEPGEILYESGFSCGKQAKSVSPLVGMVPVKGNDLNTDYLWNALVRSFSLAASGMNSGMGML